MAPVIGFVGPAGELHAARWTFRAQRESVAARRIYGTNGLRPDVWGNRIAVTARRARGRLPDTRRLSDARRAGGATVRVVDRRETGGRCDAGGRGTSTRT